MKKFFYYLLLVLVGSTSNLLAQKIKMEFKPGLIVEEYTPEKSGIHRELPEGYSQRMLEEIQNRNARASQAQQSVKAGTQVVVTYETVPPADIKTIFERAANLWATSLNSDVTINIYVQWKSLATGVLGSAGASTNVRNFVGSNRLNTWYPVALAEKMAHKNLNGTNPDIVATFNSDFTDWYTGTDGVPKLNQIDLYSVVLHEFGHGLGFIGQVGLTSDKTQASYGYPGIFDQFMLNSAGAALMDTTKYANPSAALKTQVSSNSLFISSPNIVRLNGEKGKLYAPTSFSDGSSIYHVDQAKYKVGDPNALMTPQIARGEVTRDIGPIVLGAFSDFGWSSSNIIADNYNDTEDVSKDIVFTAKVYSDTLINESSVKLMMAIDKSILSATSMPLVKSGNTYTYTLPKSSATRKINYYWTANDAGGKKFTTPAEAPVIAGTNFGSYFDFTVGADTVKPVVIYANPLKYIFNSQTTVTLPTLLTSDNIGISAVYMEYSINGAAFVRKDFTKIAGETFKYSNSFNFTSGQLKAGDVIRYRVVVADAAKISNIVYSPASGYYDFKVLALADPVATYVQNFDTTPSADFFLKGFNLTQAAGFSSGALHSVHPYADGNEESYDGVGGTDKFTNSDAILLKPIKIAADNPKIIFDEIVLVEPGEAGQSFLNADGTVNRSFFDYVIVQGSNDQGKTWYNFANGWDSNLYSTWLSKWNSASDPDGNSTAIATSTLVKSHEIDMLASGKFSVNDQVIIRFRLHADVGAHGWGWAVDNLKIQAPKVDPILAIEPSSIAKGLQISPNPSSGLLQVVYEQASDLKGIALRVIDLQGRQVFNQNYATQGNRFDQQVDLSYLGSGTYALQLQVQNQVVLKRFVIVK
ncbi:MAG: T9SS type A sorting domain-containing protein [Aquirufa sp.]|jgi:Secretion system C-terminal sorting domain